MVFNDWHLQGHEELFSPLLRHLIFQAGATRTLLDITYQGTRRLVEPYALSYKVRKDGVGQEYLLVYDQSGGRTGPGIKIFLARHIESIHLTKKSFTPRFPIELPPPGGFSSEVFFAGRARKK